MMANVLQTSILKYLKSLPDCWAIKVIAANQRGCPDILCCHKGRFLAIEVKSEGDKLTRIQSAQLARIRKAEGSTIVASSVDDVKWVAFI